MIFFRMVVYRLDGTDEREEYENQVLNLSEGLTPMNGRPLQFVCEKERHIGEQTSGFIWDALSSMWSPEIQFSQCQVIWESAQEELIQGWRMKDEEEGWEWAAHRSWSHRDALGTATARSGRPTVLCARGGDAAVRDTQDTHAGVAGQCKSSAKAQENFQKKVSSSIKYQVSQCIQEQKGHATGSGDEKSLPIFWWYLQESSRLRERKILVTQVK